MFGAARTQQQGETGKDKAPKTHSPLWQGRHPCSIAERGPVAVSSISSAVRAWKGGGPSPSPRGERGRGGGVDPSTNSSMPSGVEPDCRLESNATLAWAQPRTFEPGLRDIHAEREYCPRQLSR